MVGETKNKELQEESVKWTKRIKDLERRLEVAKSALEHVNLIKEKKEEDSFLTGDATIQALEESFLGDESPKEIVSLIQQWEQRNSTASILKNNEKHVNKQKRDLELKKIVEQNLLLRKNEEQRQELQEMLSILKRDIELKENKWKMEHHLLQRKNEEQRQDLFKEMATILKDNEKQINELMNDMELKENEWKVEREKLEDKRDALSKENKSCIEELSAFKECYEKERASWESRKGDLKGERDYFQEEFHTLLNKNLLLDCSHDKLTVGSPLQKFPETLPLWMRPLVAPKGHISGDELGVFMGALVSITAFVVTCTNENVKFIALSAFASLCGLIISTIFNNIVSRLSTDKGAKFKPTLLKGLNSLPWVIVGGLVPILGGFIPNWQIRLGVTAAATLILKMIFAYLWSVSYNISTKKASAVVALGVVGISLAAGLPHLL
ncbi:unnamed protein product [Arabidopsis arenosa]|uniref:Uncharacterized protein n=1 Tax=Arabidopsis arenosa TaxID=38785 RepID=A0A8S2B1M1_ARAAE|nr:unnamed protein product [Arabidopsis arenosa]